MSSGHAAEAGLQLSDPLVIVSVLAAVEFAALAAIGVHLYHLRLESDGQ